MRHVAHRPRLAALLLLAACAPALRAVEPRPAPAAAARPTPAPPALRIDPAVRPVRGALDLTIDPAAERFSGIARYDVELAAPVDVLWLNGTELQVRQATVDGAPVEVVPGNDDFFGLRASAAFAAGPHALELRFEATIDHGRSRGVYAEKEGALTYAYTFFEPIDARRAFPCFDEPAVKIPWTLSLHVREGQLARANTALTATAPEPSGWTRFDFAPSRPLPSYLVAFMVGPFDDVDAGLAGRAKTPLHFIVPQGRAGELGFAREVTPKVVAALEAWFDMDYPYGKLDVAVVPRFWGTMEHPGLVAMGQPLTLIRPEELSPERRRRFTNILAHELAHYWFGDLVTTRWWNDTWLNEALGSWLDAVITDAVLPEAHALDDRPGNTESALSADELASAHPIRRPIEKRADIDESFDNDVTYAKGAAVMHMFEAAVGEARWRDFLRAYVRAHADQTVTAEDFFGDARASLGDAIAAGLEEFITTAGAPRLEAVPGCDAARPGLTLRQRRSAAVGVSLPAQTWRLPVCVRAGTDTATTRACASLGAEAVFVPLPWCPAWVLLNDDAAGYYRGTVDANAVRRLLTSRKAALSVREQVWLLNDLQAAVSLGEVPLDDALRLTPLLLTSPNDRLVSLGLGFSSVRLDVLPAPLEARYRAWRAQLCTPLAQRLGWTRQPDDSDDRQRLRTRALRCALEGRSKPVSSAGAAAFARFVKEGARAPLPPELLSAAMEAARLEDEAGAFEQVLALARGAADRQQRARFLSALGDVEAPALATRVRALVTGSEFDLRETSGLVVAQLASRHTRDEAWRWLSEHLDGLLSRMRGDEAGWLLSGAAGSACDPVRRADAERLLLPRAKQVPGAADYTLRALESADRCIAEQARVVPALERFLAR
ncbi:MAG: M1 family metallopeptidase [Myxococcota bacterium]